jgi:hypothetical protein
VWALNTDPCADSVKYTLRTTIGAIQRPPGAPSGAPAEFDVSVDEVNLMSVPALGNAGVTLPFSVGTVSQKFVLVFRPSAAGDFQAPLTLDALDSGMNVVQSLQTTLKGTGFEVTDKVAIDLVLDVSGSMSDVVTTVGTTNVTKLQHLQDAVNLFLGMVIPNEGDHVGITTFSAQANSPVQVQPFTQNSSTALTAATAALAVQSSTSVGAGLRRGRDDLNAAQSGLALTRQRMIVMSDGIENTAPRIEQVITVDKQPLPMVHAIGFGKPADLDDMKLKSMAGRTPFTNVNNPPTMNPATWPTPHGEYRADGDPLELRKLFLFALTDSSRLQTVSDPAGVVTSVNPFVLPAKITNCDFRIFFAVSWENPNDRIELEVVAPDGTVFRNTTLSPAICGRSGQNSMSAWLQLDMVPIDGGGTIGPRQAGTWMLRAVGVQLATGNARCTGIVLVESSLVLDVNHRKASATAPVSLSLTVNDHGVALPSASVTITVTQDGSRTPPQSTILSRLRKAVGRIDGPLNLVDSVIAALTKSTVKTSNQTVAISNGNANVSIPMSAPGRYQVEIKVTGQACGGEFQRFYQFTEAVPPPTGTGTTVTATTPSGGGITVVTVVPKSTTGERIGLGQSAGIVPTVVGGVASPVADRLDGSYIFMVEWSAKFRGKRDLQVHVNGKRVRVPSLGGATGRSKKRVKLRG